MGNPLGQNDWLNSLVGAKGEKGEIGGDGDAGDKGEKGAEGGVGPGITLIGNVPTTGQLPAGGNTQGDAYIVQANDSMHIWNGSAWIDGGSIQGPAGDKGEPGVNGTNGADGNDGADGSQGDKGQKGEVGQPGVSNIPGPSGADGNDGSDGAKGEKGDTGANGTNGTDGNDGDKGDKGEPGANGTNGNDGNDGADGSDGAKGDKGEVGGTGNAGNDGSDGDKGEKGDTGSGGGNTYVARAEWDATQNLANIHFADFSGTGAHLTTGTGASYSGEIGNFTFSNEVAPPKSVFAYAANTSTNEYILTHLNAGGDDKTYKIKGFTFNSYTSASGISNQVDAGIFSNFGSNASIDIDLQKANFDWQRVGFPTTKEAHVYIVFNF